LIAFVELSLPGMSYLGLHPLAVHAVLGKNKKQPIVEPNRLVDLFVDLLARMDIAGREPAPNASALQVSVQAVGEVLDPLLSS
jgi:hypothetical protein